MELVGAIQRAVGHVVDDDVEVRVMLDEWDEGGHTRDWREDGHRDF